MASTRRGRDRDNAMIEHAIADTLDEAPHEVTAMLEAMKAGRLPLCARALPLASRADPHDVRRASPTRSAPCTAVTIN